MKKNFEKMIKNDIIKVVILIIIFSGFGLLTYGQTQLYFQNFGTGTTFPTGWSAANGGTWTISTTNPSTTPTFSGGSNISSGSNNAARTVTYSNNLSTVGYSNITILWGARKTHTNSVTCEWSPDGNIWNTLSFTDVTNNSTWAWVNGGARIALPAGASGATDLSFRWTYDSDGTAGRYRIDDFSVEGCLLPAQPSTITGITNPCQTLSQTYSVINIAGVTYNWTFPAGWMQTGGGTTNSVTVTVGTGNGNITVTPSNACGNGTARTLAVTTATVPAQPAAISGSSSPCQGSSQTYNVTNVAGVTYNWTFPIDWTQTGGGTTNSVTVTVGTSSGNITVTPSNTCGSGTPRTLAVTTTTVPAQPSLITGSTAPCVGSSQGYSVTSVPGVTYNWVLPTGWIKTGGGTTNAITVTVGAASGNITVTPSNGCGNGTAQTLAVTPSTVPAQPSVISGITNPCQTSSQTYSVINIAGVTYNWTFPAGWMQTGGGTTNSVTVTVGTGNGNITVTPSNACGNGTARTLAVTTATVPAQPGAISGSSSPCQGSLQTYNVTNVAGVTYNWTFPIDWTQTGGGTTNSVTVTVGTSSGNITVTPSNTCGSGTPRTLAVTTTTVPAQPGPIVGDASPCVGSIESYSVTNVTGVTYNWVLPTGWIKIGGGTSNSISVIVGTNSGTVTVTPSNGCGNGTPQTLAVVTTASVPAQPSVISGNTNPCQTSSQVYSVTNIAGVTYNWAFPAGWVQTGGGTTNSVTVTVGTGSGFVRVTPSNSCGNGTQRILSVIISPLPAQPSTISGDNTPQEGFEETYAVTNVTGVTYNWSFPSGWVQTGGGTTNSITVLVGSGSGNITVTPSNACGIGTPRNLAVTVTLCVVNTFPWTEPFEVPFLPDCWSKIVYAGNDITRSNQQNHTTGGTFSARFSSDNNSSNYNQYLFSPPIHITNGYTDLSFWTRKFDTSNELFEWGVATTTNPDDYTWYSVNLSNTQWTETVFDFSDYTGQNIFVGFHYYGNNIKHVYLDDVSVKAHVLQPGLWTGNVSTNWGTAGNWDNGVVPAATTNVTIPSTAPNWPVYSGNLTLGTTCNNITMYGQSQLTISGDISITAGKTLTCYANANVNIGGNFTRTGAFNAGTSTVNFYGSTSSTISGSSAPWTIFSDGFETNAGWTLSGEFQRGTPQGMGGSTGNPDPSFAFSGTNVLGVDLTGLGSYPYDYERNLTNRAYQAISPTINCSGYTNIVLNFRRWLGVQRQDRAYIDISTNNGATWTQIWRNNNTINPSSWSLQTINISAYANNQSQVKIRFCMGTSNNNRQYCGWNIDDVQITAQISSVITFYNLVNSKSNAELISNAHINVVNDFEVKPDAWFTNTINNAINVGADALLKADATGMASYIDNGGTTVNGTTNVEQYITSERWHLVSSPLTDATINTYYDVHLKFYNEPTNTWTYLVNPTTIPMNIAQGYSAWSSDSYLGTTTVTFSTILGQMNNTEITVDTLDFTSGAPLAGFNLLGNPYPCALNWSSSWPMTNLSGWMQIYDNGVYRGYNIDGTSYNGGTPIIPPTQGFWVRATGSDASITIPLAERIHNGQDFYKEGSTNDYPTVSLSSEINGMTDETKLVFSPQAFIGLDPKHDLEKFVNVDEAPTLFTISDGKEFAVNYMPEDYDNLIIPVGFKTGQAGLYQIKSPIIANLPTNVHVYLQDVKEDQTVELYENSVYEFVFSPLDESHRFNLIFKDGYFGTDEFSMDEISIYSFKNEVYVRMPEGKNAEIIISDLLGREIMQASSSGESISKITLNHGSGYYIVRVQTDDQFVTEKVFIK